MVLALVSAAAPTLLLSSSLVTRFSDTALVPALEVAAVAVVMAGAKSIAAAREGGLTMVEELATASDLLATRGGARFQRRSWREAAGLGEEMVAGGEVSQPTSLLVAESQASSTRHGPLGGGRTHQTLQKSFPLCTMYDVCEDFFPQPTKTQMDFFLN